MKLGTKLTLIYLLIITLSLLILGALVTSLLESHFVYDAGENLTAEARSISALLARDQRLNATNIGPAIKKVSENLKVRISVISLDGEVIADSEIKPSLIPNQAGEPEFGEALKSGKGKAIRRSQVLGKEMLFVAIPLDEESQVQGVMRLAIPLSQVESSFSHIREIGALSTVAAAIVATILGLLFVRSITKPIEEMTSMAEQIAAGDLSPRTSLTNRDEVGKLAESLNVMADQLSARMKALIDSQRRRQLLIDHMTDGVIMTSSRGSIIITNPAALELLSLRADQLVGRPLLEIIASDELAKAIDMAAKRDIVVDCTFPYGPHRQVLRADVLAIKEDEDESFLMVLHDITKEHALDRMRRDFIANFSHELKTPITGLTLLSETLSDAIRENREEAAYFAEVIRDEATRLASFVEQLMDMAKLDSDNVRAAFEHISVNEAIEEVIQYCEPLANKKGLELEVEMPASLLIVDGDRGQLRMLFQNLIENAIKYTARGKVSVHVQQSKGWIEVTIADTGIGIAKQDLPRIFERFFRADKARSRATGGSGLGLSIVSKIVENHNGKVKVESKFGESSSFRVLLPVADIADGGEPILKTERPTA
ncbi:MAG: cell wall metabolism sensor histidine kinase WalK [Actinobacteria bacterium]|nr:cell wall metabolism sensor histidine kinase WalK [Actinomycetota bacterium]